MVILGLSGGLARRSGLRREVGNPGLGSTIIVDFRAIPVPGQPDSVLHQPIRAGLYGTLAGCPGPSLRRPPSRKACPLRKARDEGGAWTSQSRWPAFFPAGWLGRRMDSWLVQVPDSGRVLYTTVLLTSGLFRHQNLGEPAENLDLPSSPSLPHHAAAHGVRWCTQRWCTQGGVPGPGTTLPYHHPPTRARYYPALPCPTLPCPMYYPAQSGR